MSASLFVLVSIAMLASVPALAACLRSALPPRRAWHESGPRAKPVRVEEVVFGGSQKARRSPRHAVLLHRALLGAYFMAVAALMLVPAALALRSLGPAVVSAALWLVLPVLLVTLHAERGPRG